ncbi:MAG: hypothetical protein KJO95_06060 [Gammaproteobacteria bacterium]|nr:hypothetical protein [Woeseia sp.]MBT8102515.1 hypothetical protein [Gammaproteobacteria bacterium]
MTAVTADKSNLTSRPATTHRLFYFLTELRRRRVCRAITMYSVALWLVCQILDVISPALQLPDWTLKLAIVFGLLGLPIIVIASWLFEITPEGLAVERAGEADDYWAEHGGRKHIADRLIDWSLILVALTIGAQLTISALGDEVKAADGYSSKIAVMPFRATADEEAARLSDWLAIELQHALRHQFGATVIASTQPTQLKGSMKLTGAVSTSDETIRVAVTMIDFDTGVVFWSGVFERPITESSQSSGKLAQAIVAAIPRMDEDIEAIQVADAAR